MQIKQHEVGKVYSNKNFKSLVNAYRSLRTALGELLADDAIADDDSETKTKEQKEATTWSLSDVAQALSREASEKLGQNAYILDIFPDENAIVYQIGWRGGYFQCNYSIDGTGVATFGDPVEVSRKVSYVPTSDNAAPPAVTMTTEESAAIELSGDSIELIERAVSDSGVTMLKLISPGIGSSGYYPADVLKRDGPKVFTKGLHNLIDHPTAQEEAARPEGSIDRLGSTLIEDAQWYDSWRDSKGKDHGAGLYARAKVVPNFAEKLDVIAGDIGVSIRASGKARYGKVDGREMPIVETIDRAKSVDYVTLPGRGGKVIELMESAKAPAEKDQAMPIDEKAFAELQETNRALALQLNGLRESMLRNEASTIVDRALASFTTVPAPIKSKISAAMAAKALPMTESAALDTKALLEAVQDAVANETAYLASLGLGQVRGLGGAALQESAPKIEDLEKEIAENLAAIK